MQCQFANKLAEALQAELRSLRHLREEDAGA